MGLNKVLILLGMILALNRSGWGNPVGVKAEGEVLPPFGKCFREICDLRTHYCDQIIESCASCANDCHPDRLSDDVDTAARCQKLCAWYYVFREMKTTTITTPPTTAGPASSTSLPAATEQKKEVDVDEHVQKSQDSKWSQWSSPLPVSMLVLSMVVLLLVALNILTVTMLRGVIMNRRKHFNQALTRSDPIYKPAAKSLAKPCCPIDDSIYRIEQNQEQSRPPHQRCRDISTSWNAAPENPAYRTMDSSASVTDSSYPLLR